MAAKQGRLDELGDYGFSHEVVHGGFAAHINRYKMRREGGDSFLHLYTTTHDPGAVGATAAFAVKCALLAHRSVSRIFDWSDDEQVESLLAEADGLGSDAETFGRAKLLPSIGASSAPVAVRGTGSASGGRGRPHHIPKRA